MKIFKELIPFLYQKGILYTYSVKKIKSVNPKKEIPVVVSLTSIPSRIKFVHLTIRSLLVQTKRPVKILLWIHESHKNLITKELKKLEGEIFEIHYASFDIPHLKLVETLKKFPQSPIVTVDDDHIYDNKLLQILYETHLQKPEKIISTISRLIKFDAHNRSLPYTKWPYVEKLNYESRFLLPLGVFGVLYPPNSFDEKVTNIELIETLSPKADDLWFKALSLIKGTEVAIAGNKIKKPTLILKTQEITLKNHNVSQDNNRIQWDKLVDYFSIQI